MLPVNTTTFPLSIGLTIERGSGGEVKPFSSRFGPERLRPLSLKTFQINLGKVCNQACRHCHVDASPARTETMSAEIADYCLRAIKSCPEIETVDITGGAPEMHAQFRPLVRGAKALGKHVIDRCNLTILEEPGYEDMGEFLLENEVEIIASLPCYTASNTDRQRGNGVFAKSIAALRRLNGLGYGFGLPLNLVYNPGGASLSPPQEKLEREYKEKLQGDFGITFNRLYCMNNLPISRFLEDLTRRGKFQDYMDLLAGSFNPESLNSLMCRHQVSVGFDGRVYDCDFNQMLEIEAESVGHVRHFNAESFLSRNIRTESHCYGCTAGAGSSCGGQIMQLKTADSC